MSNSNEHALKTAYAEVGRGNIDALMRLLSNEIVWCVSGQSPLAGDYRGKDGVLHFFARMAELYQGTLRLEVQDILANERRGIVLTAENFVHDSAHVAYRSVHHFEFRDGKCWLFHALQDDAYNGYWYDKRESDLLYMNGAVDAGALPTVRAM
jgi:uncharacterized protein